MPITHRIYSDFKEHKKDGIVNLPYETIRLAQDILSIYYEEYKLPSPHFGHDEYLYKGIRIISRTRGAPMPNRYPLEFFENSNNGDIGKNLQSLLNKLFSKLTKL